MSGLLLTRPLRPVNSSPAETWMELAWVEKEPRFTAHPADRPILCSIGLPRMQEEQSPKPSPISTYALVFFDEYVSHHSWVYAATNSRLRLKTCVDRPTKLCVFILLYAGSLVIIRENHSAFNPITYTIWTIRSVYPGLDLWNVIAGLCFVIVDEFV